MDNFDLKKFLKESKALENLNPSIKSIKREILPLGKNIYDTLPTNIEILYDNG